MKKFLQSIAIVFAGLMLALGCEPPNMPPLPPEVDEPAPVTVEEFAQIQSLMSQLQDCQTKCESLSVRLAAAESEKEAALAGWRQAYAAWERDSRASLARDAAAPRQEVIPGQAPHEAGRRLFRLGGR